jgi:hypothetical protein
VKVRFLADENVDSDVVLGLKRRVEDVGIVRVQDVGLRTRDDPTILQWAADEGRVVVSHDVRTLPAFAYERVTAGLVMPGLLAASKALPLVVVIDELALIAEASEAAAWVDRVVYLPLR